MPPNKKQRQKKKTTAELSKLKIEQFNKQPIIETVMHLSEDKKWLIYKTTITDIKPMSYMKKVLA